MPFSLGGSQSLMLPLDLALLMQSQATRWTPSSCAHGVLHIRRRGSQCVTLAHSGTRRASRGIRRSWASRFHRMAITKHAQPLGVSHCCVMSAAHSHMQPWRSWSACVRRSACVDSVQQCRACWRARSSTCLACISVARCRCCLSWSSGLLSRMRRCARFERRQKMQTAAKLPPLRLALFRGCRGAKVASSRPRPVTLMTVTGSSCASQLVPSGQHNTLRMVPRHGTWAWSELVRTPSSSALRPAA